MHDRSAIELNHRTGLQRRGAAARSAPNSAMCPGVQSMSKAGTWSRCSIAGVGDPRPCPSQVVANGSVAAVAEE